MSNAIVAVSMIIMLVIGYGMGQFDAERVQPKSRQASSVCA